MDKLFLEGLKALWGLKEEDRLEVFWRKVKNKAGDEYEYPVARIRKGNKVFYRHLSQSLLDASNEIKRRGAKKEIQKLEKQLSETLLKATHLMEQIEELSASFNLPISNDLKLLLKAFCSKFGDKT